MFRRRAAVLATTLLTVALAACGGGGSGASGGSSGGATALKPGAPITMQQLRFHPDNTQVTVGQRVTWRNDESIPHDVVAKSGATFESKTFGKGGTFAWTPTTAGTVSYVCTLHPGMDGTLHVVAK